DGTAVLVLVGLDSVKLEGKPFIAHVAQGDRVTVGQLLLEVDLDALDAAGVDSTTPVVVLNAGANVQPLVRSGAVEAGKPLLIVSMKESSHATA
ncbi:MAG TPA: PTS glucose transporter subunit IIA, partial [Mycobacterium sp.]